MRPGGGKQAGLQLDFHRHDEVVLIRCVFYVDAQHVADANALDLHRRAWLQAARRAGKSDEKRHSADNGRQWLAGRRRRSIELCDLVQPAFSSGGWGGDSNC
jgi:hypothetical protein